jgi:hypothetical protein
VVRARVYTVKEFVGWFKRQVASEMGCRDVDVTSVGVYAGGALVAFKCDGKKYLARIRNGRRFKVSVYAYVYEDNKLVGIRKLRLYPSEDGPFKVYDSRFGINSDNALFYVEDGVNIDVYETQPRGGLLKPRDY